MKRRRKNPSEDIVLFNRAEERCACSLHHGRGEQMLHEEKQPSEIMSFPKKTLCVA